MQRREVFDVCWKCSRGDEGADQPYKIFFLLQEGSCTQRLICVPQQGLF